MVWDGVTQIFFERAKDNLTGRIEPHNQRLQAEADQAQRGNNYRTRLINVRPLPQITTLGVLVPRAKAKNVEEGKGLKDKNKDK